MKGRRLKVDASPFAEVRFEVFAPRAPLNVSEDDHSECVM